jgi:5-methylcytosine-specific restriction endonuclease McrA
MGNLEQLGWHRLHPRRYRHYCGAELTKTQGGWLPITVSGERLPSHAKVADAALHIQQSDSSFWTHGSPSIIGACAGVWEYATPFGPDQKHLGVTLHVKIGQEFPSYLGATVRRYLAEGTCMKCRAPMTLRFRRLRCFYEGSNSEGMFVACSCGNPVWSICQNLFFKLEDEMRRNITAWERKKNIQRAGGRHSKQEITEILALQGNRCLYCNVKFSDDIRPTRDHLISAAYGGSNWALNIVLACRSCNSRRAETPFRSYCRLLTPAQNKIIMEHLQRRIDAILVDQNTNLDAFRCFCAGLILHDPKDSRYRQLYRTSSVMRENARKNKLLPTLPLIKRAMR